MYVCVYVCVYVEFAPHVSINSLHVSVFTAETETLKLKTTSTMRGHSNTIGVTCSVLRKAFMWKRCCCCCCGCC